MANIRTSPGITVNEIDLSNILVPAGISNGATVIRSPKGPINRPIPISDDKNFIDIFGPPVFTSGATLGDVPGITNTVDLQQVPDYGYGSYGALQFLTESSSLLVVRGWSTSDQFANVFAAANLSASSYTSGTNYFNDVVAPAASYSDFDKVDHIQALDGYMNSPNIAGQALYVFANNPSDDGTNTAVTIEAFSPWSDWRFSYDAYPSNPIAASATSLVSMSADTFYHIASNVFKINVYTKPDSASWTAYLDKTGNAGIGQSLGSVSANAPSSNSLRITPVETFYGTLTPMRDQNNNQLWIEGQVNGVSKFIYVKAGSSSTMFTNLSNYDSVPVKKDNYGTLVYSKQLLQLANGTSTQSTGIGQIAGWAGFQDRETTNANILINADWNATVKQEVGRVAANRQDAVGVGQVGTFKNTNTTDVLNSEFYGYVDPSYMALYSGFSKIYDQYNDKFLMVPNSIFGASLMARTDRVSNPWMAPAGTNRGILPVLDQNKIWNTNDIGNLYVRNINSVKYMTGVGFVMFGQKTAQLKASALDRINVRRLLIYIETNLETAFLQFLFENNTDKTRLRVFSVGDEFLKSIYAADGLYAYKIVCDSTNNTSQIIDSNQLAVDVYLQPAKDIEFITLNAIITRTGVSFQ